MTPDARKMILPMQQVLPSADARGGEYQSFMPVSLGAHELGCESLSLATIRKAKARMQLTAAKPQRVDVPVT